MSAADDLQIRFALRLPRTATSYDVLQAVAALRTRATLAEAQLAAVLSARREVRDPILAIDDAVREIAERLERGERFSLRDALTVA